MLGGILGGLISSTATTVSYARRARLNRATSSMAALVVMIASTTVFVRVIVEITVVSPTILVDVVPPLAALMGLMALISAGMYFAYRGQSTDMPIDGDPSELRAAILFGSLYAAVLLAVAFVKSRFGSEALYVVAALSGLTDMDAITLSTAQMIKRNQLDTDVGWRMILIGVLSNLVFKAGAIAVLGCRELLVRIVSAFAIALAGGVLLLIFWQ